VKFVLYKRISDPGKPEMDDVRAPENQRMFEGEVPENQKRFWRVVFWEGGENGVL